MNHLFQLISISAQSHIPVLLVGYPGEGKTSFINSLARSLNRHCETIIGSIREPSDVGGLPVRTQNGVELLAPKWAQILHKEPGILFIDEILTCTPAMQAALLRVCFDKVVGDLALHPETIIIAAANPPEISPNGVEMSPPLANRFVHFNWELDYKEWTQGMIEGFPDLKFDKLPESWESKIPSKRALVSSFISHKPNVLRVFPKEESARSGPWPSPRTWDFASRLLAAFEAAGTEPYGAVSGCIGPAAATEFFTFTKNLDLPDPEDLLKNPKAYTPDNTRDDRNLAVLNSVVAAVLANNTKERWQKAFDVIGVFIDANKKDLATIAAQTLLLKEPKGVKPPMAILAKLSLVISKAQEATR